MRAAEATGCRHYGDGGTIHGSTELDVEVGPDGDVAVVWFRCLPLPFRQRNVSEGRSDEMAGAAEHIRITGVEVNGW